MCRCQFPALLLLTVGVQGCASPYHSEQGALFGGLTGAGVGALVGEVVGDPLAGAAVGAGVGSLTGAVVGDRLDQIEARNQAEISARLGRPASARAVSVQDVVAMSRAGIEEEIIVNHIRIKGISGPLQTADLIYLKDSGVVTPVIKALQDAPIARTTFRHTPAPVVVGHYYDDPWCRVPRFHYRGHHPQISWGASFSRGY